MGDHNADTVKLSPPGAASSFDATSIGRTVDADNDGQPDTVGIDDTGPQGKPDGVIDRRVNVEVLRAPGGRRVRVAVLGYADPEPALPRLPDVIRTNSEYDVSAVTRPLNELADRFRGNWKRWQSLAVLGGPVLFVVGMICGWFAHGLYYPPQPAGASRSARVLDALYRRGHVPPAAEQAARKALIEDGVGDPERGE